MKEIKEGTILLQETCDEILIGLNGNTTEVNKHIEHWLVKDIKKNEFVLYNLDNQRIWKISKDKMQYYLFENKKYNIKAIFTISNEVA